MIALRPMPTRQKAMRVQLKLTKIYILTLFPLNLTMTKCKTKLLIQRIDNISIHADEVADFLLQDRINALVRDDDTHKTSSGWNQLKRRKMNS